MLAPNYYWNWGNDSQELANYRNFVANIAVEGPSYDPAYSNFTGSLPVALRCIRDNACAGGLKSECEEGYTGLLCSQCDRTHYLRMNSCEKCPTKARAALQAVGIILAFVLVIIAVIWGDSKRAGQTERTWADVILSGFKIVISFYQVIMGVFSALSRVRWPASVILMTRWLRYVEANFLELGNLSCLDPRLRLDPLQQFVLTVCFNVGVVCLFLFYLGIRGILIHRKKGLSTAEKENALSATRKSCYRNIFLFLFTTYPPTCVRIVQVVPSACIRLCFSESDTRCSSLLLSDLSVNCSSPRYNKYWPFAAVLLLYPVGFPVLILGLLWKFYHKVPASQVHTDQQNPSESMRTLQDVASQSDPDSDEPAGSSGSSDARPSAAATENSTASDEAGPNDEMPDTDVTIPSSPGSPDEQQRSYTPYMTFALSLFYENYKRKFWFWEVTEMYRKLILVTGLTLIGSHSHTQIGIGVLLAGGFAMLHAAFQPIRDKFESGLQTVALVVVFFDLALGVMLKTTDSDVPVNSVNSKNDATGVEVLFVFINCLVVGIAFGESTRSPLLE